jgi:hypothetical protein
MFQKPRTVAIATVFLMTSTLVVTVPAQEPESPDPNSGFFFYAGGPVRAKRARTQTRSTTFNETAGWVNLPGATLSYVVPAGTTDLFNIAFSAECRVFNGGGDDYLRIRIAHTVGGVTTFVEPYDGAQAFCDADSYATHKGNWVKRVGAGTHTIQVQFWIFDGPPFEVVTAWVDDWTFELVVYD